MRLAVPSRADGEHGGSGSLLSTSDEAPPTPPPVAISSEFGLSRPPRLSHGCCPPLLPASDGEPSCPLTTPLASVTRIFWGATSTYWSCRWSSMLFAALSVRQLQTRSSPFGQFNSGGIHQPPGCQTLPSPVPSHEGTLPVVMEPPCVPSGGPYPRCRQFHCRCPLRITFT